jgi:hypothetical protein
MTKTLILLVSLFSIRSFAEDPIVIKNFREIFESLSVASGVTADTATMSAYNSFKPVLPKFGNPEEYSAAMQIAVIRLAGYFCRSLITQDAAKTDPVLRRAHKSVNFSAGPVGLSEIVRKDVLSNYAKLYWQRDLSTTELKSMQNMADALIARAPTTTTGTRNVCLAMCTAVASSLEFLVV